MFQTSPGTAFVTPKQTRIHGLWYKLCAVDWCFRGLGSKIKQAIAAMGCDIKCRGCPHYQVLNDCGGYPGTWWNLHGRLQWCFRLMSEKRIMHTIQYMLHYKQHMMVWRHQTAIFPGLCTGVEYGCRCCNPTNATCTSRFPTAGYLLGHNSKASEQPGEGIACMNIHVLEEAKLGWIYTKSWISIQLSFCSYTYRSPVILIFASHGVTD
jgi:hypothetical protein